MAYDESKDKCVFEAGCLYDNTVEEQSKGCISIDVYQYDKGPCKVGMVRYYRRDITDAWSIGKLGRLSEQELVFVMGKLTECRAWIAAKQGQAS